MPSLGRRSAEPAWRDALSASLFFDVSDFLLQVDDVRLDALELGDRLLPVLADACPLIRIVTARELARQAVDAHLQRVEQNFVSMKLLARLADARAPPGLVFRLLDLVCPGKSGLYLFENLGNGG